MPGISGAAKVAKAVATSNTTKEAVKKAAGSNVTKTIVSTIVIETALPELKKRVAARLKADEDEPQSNNATSQELGEWNAPSQLGLDIEEYRAYLRAQLHVLGSYEAYLESYDTENFQSYTKSYHETSDDLEDQLKAVEIAVRSLDGYINHLETFAVENEDFREFVLQCVDRNPNRPSFSRNSVNVRAQLRQADEYLSDREAYLDALLEYTTHSSEFGSHVERYDVIITGSVSELETAVSATIDYISYLEKFGKKSEKFHNHAAAFEVADHLHYGLLEAENILIKNLERRTE